VSADQDQRGSTPVPADTQAEPEAHLEGLGARFMAALELVRRGEIDDATGELNAILSVEPRLAEPRMELARVLLDSGRLDESEAQAREALRSLKAGGQWVEELPEPVVTGLAHGLLAEILRQIADTDAVIFGDPERFRAITKEARTHFEAAAHLDPDNQHASYHAFFIGLGQDDEPAD